MFDLVFACPPYYRVERYVDYDGEPPAGEINALSTYEAFRDTLFAGYRVAIDHLDDNRFIVIMTGDSRDSKGAYHCHEAETELFLKDQGLTVYNKLEASGSGCGSPRVGVPGSAATVANTSSSAGGGRNDPAILAGKCWGGWPIPPPHAL